MWYTALMMVQKGRNSACSSPAYLQNSINFTCIQSGISFEYECFRSRSHSPSPLRPPVKSPHPVHRRAQRISSQYACMKSPESGEGRCLSCVHLSSAACTVQIPVTRVLRKACPRILNQSKKSNHLCLRGLIGACD